MVYQSFLTRATLLVYSVTVSASAPKLHSRTPIALKAASADVVTSNYLELSRQPGSQSAKHLNAIRRGGYAKTGLANVTSLFDGEEFSAPITMEEATFNVIIDTGSSDTWLVETGFSW